MAGPEAAGRDGGGGVRRQRPGHAADDRGVPAQRRSRPATRGSTGRPWSGFSPTFSACATSSGSAGASTATTPTATSMTWRGSSMPGRSSPSSSRARAIPTTSPCRKTCGGSRRHATRTASRSGVVPLPMPEPVVFEGQRLPASYANFYIANRLVLVPTFNDPADRVALDTLASLFPDRRGRRHPRRRPRPRASGRSTACRSSSRPFAAPVIG